MADWGMRAARLGLVFVLLQCVGTTAFGQLIYTPYTFKTIAGNSRSTCGSADGPALGATLCSPTSVAVDSKGTVWVNGARKISPSGVISTYVPTSDSNPGYPSFNNP